ncbi:MAG: host attachment protein, partial [Massilia sp.]
MLSLDEWDVLADVDQCHPLNPALFDRRQTGTPAELFIAQGRKGWNQSGRSASNRVSIHFQEQQMAVRWIVAANAGRARLFAQKDGRGKLDEINDMVNAAVRLRTAETEPDRIGPTSAGKSIHNVGAATPNKNYEPPQTPTEHEAELFARSVVGEL